MDTPKSLLLGDGGDVPPMRRRRSVRASLRLLGSRWMSSMSSGAGTSTSPSASATASSRLSRRLPAAQLLPNRGVTSPPSLSRVRRAERVQDALADGAHPLPLTPEYQRRLQACAPITAAIKAPVVLDAAALRPRNASHARRRASTATPAPTLPPRAAREGHRSPPPVPPRRKSTKLTTTAVSTRRQEEDRAEQQHEYENLDELLRQVAAAPARPPPSPVRTYCRAPCRLKMMSLLDSDVKHTCVLPAGSHMPRPLAALSGGQPSPARYGLQQPCVAPCPLKLTSMLHGGAKHVCIPRMHPRASSASPCKENEDPAEVTPLPPSTPTGPAGPASYAAADESPRGCCRTDRFPHLADDCTGDEDEDVDVTGVDTTCSTVGSSSPVSIASADDARSTPQTATTSGPPRMTRSSSSGALQTLLYQPTARADGRVGRPGRPGRRRSVSTKRTPSNASTKSDFVVVKQRRRSLRWPAATAGSAPQKLQELGKHRHRGEGGGGRVGGGGGDLGGSGGGGGTPGGTGMEFLVDGLHLTRTHQKKKVPTTLDKLQHIDIHSHALFAAVEQGHVDRARTILQSTDVDINSVNSDGLSPLDVAVLVNSKPMAKILVAFGAQEGNQFKNPEALNVHLKQLVLEADMRLQDLGGHGHGLVFANNAAGQHLLFNNLHNANASHSRSSSISGGGGGGGGGLGPSLGLAGNGSVSSFATPSLSVSTADSISVTSASSSGDKQLSIWERRVKSLKRMLLGFEQARCPDEPFLVAVDVTGTHSVTVRFQEPETLDSHICTKFKVEWSCSPDFNVLAGEREVLDLTHSECHISDLVQGQRYHFRVACGNLRGYSLPVLSSPPSVVPSSWRDVDGREARFTGVSLRVLDNLFTEMRKARPEFAAEIKDIQESSSPGGETPNVQRRKKTTIKQLFTAASKFQKNLRRGVYLSCILYHEDRVLVTNEDFLPVIEVDETYPSCIYNDFHWLMKVACTWDDVKSLRQDMEKSLNSSSIHFRIKLLQAAAQMQTALCIQDLGQLYHKPLRDSQGTLVISMVNYVRSPKSVSVLNSRWLPIGKVVKKASNHDDPNVGEILMTSIQEQIMYHQVSSIRLSRGLYLGYLKMHSSVDLIQVVVPSKTPNVLPHCKIRDNPHVSAEEWEGLKRLRGKLSAAVASQAEKDNIDDSQSSDQSAIENLVSNAFHSEQQRVFVDLIASTARRLFSYMEINTEESQLHRLYDVEVVDLTPEVSFLVAVPPAESACAVPGQRDMLLQRGDLLSLPVQVFEMVHLASYQHNVISRYSRLSCILELDMLLAQHSLREAFSTAEVSQAKERLWKLQEIDSQLNAVKKGIRWLMDLVTFTRDRGNLPVSGPPGIPMRTLLAIGAPSKGKDGGSLGVKRSLLQIPPRDQKLVKSSASRGSWPGPGVSGAPCLLATEFSKSEQQLNTSRNTASTTTIASPSIAVATLSLSPPPPSLSNPRSGGSAPVVSGTPRKGSAGSVGSVGVNAASPSYSNSSVCSTSLGGTNSASTLKGLPNSRSEDTLLLSSSQRAHPMGHQRSRSSVLTASVSATTSPLLSVRSSIHVGQPVGSAISVSGMSTGSGTSGVSGGNMTATSESQHSLSSEDSAVVNISSPANKNTAEEEDDEGSAGSVIVPIPSSGILQVYAAYKTGLASGTSLKVHVTPQTSAREVVDLVVKQLNLAAVLKGKGGPVYPDDRLDNFCLVAVIGARERCLRDDFKPLQLQNPWRKGRLYVRQKHDVLAALDQCARRPTAFL